MNNEQGILKDEVFQAYSPVFLILCDTSVL
jgi:hypothetical protein